MSESMFEASYENSRFLKLYSMDKENLSNDFSVSLAFCDDGQLMGVLIFEHLKHDIESFQYDYKKHKFQTLGRLMVYIKPKFRNQGVARKLIENFDTELKIYINSNQKYKHDILFVINAVDRAYKLCHFYLSDFVISNTNNNFSVNKRDSKDALRYYSQKPIWS